MNGLTRRLFPALTALMLSLWLTGCAGETQGDAEGTAEASHAEEAGEHAVAESAEGAGEHAAREGEGEHGEAREGGEAAEGGEHREGGEAREGGEHAEEGEHGGEGGHDEEGEESGEYIGAAETWDVVRRGARLVLSFDADSNAFVGTVENTTEGRLCAIRVEVHISTGTELGPTARTDLPAGQTTSVRLPTEGEAFESFTAHPEMSPCGSD
jgi:hypothetical protein